MRINENTLLEGEKVVLVPYNADHVPRYHEWMKSAELQKLTASEPLTLEQEYDMQRDWREDDDKLTFIILDKQRWAEPALQEEQCMVGDVNIFLTDPADPSLAELEVMIAEPSYRGQGLGKEVTLMMMRYGITRLGIQKFEAKIGLDNPVSIAMFKKLHFHELSKCRVFKEVTLGLTVDEALKATLHHDTLYMKERQHRESCCSAGQHMTTGGQHMTAGGQHMTAGGQHMTTGGQHMTTGGQHMTTGGQHMTTGAQHMTAGGQHMTAGGQHMTTGGQHMPTGGQHMNSP